MNKQELIEKIKDLPDNIGLIRSHVDKGEVLSLVKQLGEPEKGHADEAPRYVKNILARLRELPLHDREVWLKAIMGEFEQDFSHAKWREGYEQGKLEGMVEREKVKVPQFVADWYEEHKDILDKNIAYLCLNNWGEFINDKTLFNWMSNTDNFIQTLVNMHQFGYEVDEEKKYKITLLNRNDGDLYLVNQNAGVSNKYGHFSPTVLLFTKGTNFSEKCYKLTKKEVVLNDFGWVFDCPGIKIEEVE